MAASRKGLLVDLDDTLVAFDAVTDISWRQVCDEYARAHGDADSGAIFTAVRKVADWYWSDADRHRAGRTNMAEARRAIVAQAFDSIGLPAAEARGLADRYSSVRLDNMYLLPDVHGTLELLRTRGHTLAVVTNGDSETQRLKIDRFDLRRHFDAVVVEGELGYGKPDPRAYLHALGLLGLRPDRACMVGDNIVWDVDAPQRLGMAAIWIDRTGRGPPPDRPVVPRWTVRAFAEVRAVLSGD